MKPNKTERDFRNSEGVLKRTFFLNGKRDRSWLQLQLKYVPVSSKVSSLIVNGCILPLLSDLLFKWGISFISLTYSDIVSKSGTNKLSQASVFETVTKENNWNQRNWSSFQIMLLGLTFASSSPFEQFGTQELQWNRFGPDLYHSTQSHRELFFPIKCSHRVQNLCINYVISISSSANLWTLPPNDEPSHNSVKCLYSYSELCPRI